MGKTSFPKMILTIEVRDKNGKLIERRKMEAKTFVYYFVKLLHDAFMNTNINVVSTNGTGVTFTPQTGISTILAVNADANVDTYGILVGSDTRPYDPYDYKLYNKIGNSVLAHSATNVDAFIDVNTTTTPKYISFNISRTFTNNTNSNVSVSEVGLVAYGGGNYIMLARDVLSSPITIPPGGTLTVTYSIQLIFG